MTNKTCPDKNLAFQALKQRLRFLPQNCQLSTPISELRMDSLDFVELLVVIQEEFNVSITKCQADQIKTIDDLMEMIVSQQS